MEAVPLRILITTFTVTSWPYASSPKVHISIHLHGNEPKWKRVRQKQDLTFEHRPEEESNGSKVVKIPS